MLTEKEIEMIQASVNRKYFDIDKLIAYLNSHSIVGNDVFSSVVIDPESMPARLNGDLGDKYGYTPIPVETFLRRVPFYFYYPDDEEKAVTSAWLGAIVRRVYLRERKRDEEIEADLEKTYQALEEIYYHFHIDVADIFAYMDVRGYRLKTDQFMEWYDYLKLCEQLHRYDYMPDDFLYKYNMALEAAGREPVIYDLTDVALGEYVWRDGNQIEIEGTFPLDPAGNPVMRWIGIILKKPGKIKCAVEENHIASRLIIELTPRTELYARNLYNDEKEGEKWYRLYAGPQIMEFDYTVLKQNRQRLNMTQKEVAEAVGATLRTYQKWEIGETTPDSKFLLRLLNWLDIRDVVDATKWNEDWDSVEGGV